VKATIVGKYSDATDAAASRLLLRPERSLSSARSAAHLLAIFNVGKDDGSRNRSGATNSTRSYTDDIVVTFARKANAL
jgi:hypothetical protein